MKEPNTSKNNNRSDSFNDRTSLTSVDLDNAHLSSIDDIATIIIDLDDEEENDNDNNDRSTTTKTPVTNTGANNTSPSSSSGNEETEEGILSNTSSDAMNLALDGRVYNTDIELDHAEAIVVAPLDFLEESVLRLDIGNNQIAVVQVPPGGVSKGETFRGAYRIYNHAKPNPSPPDFRKKKPADHHDRRYHQYIPQYHNRRWNSGLFDCCKYGFCHPSFIGAFCCNCVLLAQVMTRMNLNHWGKKETRSIYRGTVTRIFIVFAFYYMIRAILLRSLIASLTPVRDENGNKNENDDDTDTKSLLWIGFVFDAIMMIYAFILLKRTRRAVRDKYSIPGGVVDDCCEPLCCYCCSLSRIARQTADYDQRDATWCTVTGISTEFDEEYGLYAPVPDVSMNRVIV